MVAWPGFDIPLWVIRRQIASDDHIVVQVSRLMGARQGHQGIRGSRPGGENYTMQDIFTFKQTGGRRKTAERRAAFSHRHSAPNCLERLTALGTGLPLAMFERRLLQPGAARAHT